MLEIIKLSCVPDWRIVMNFFNTKTTVITIDGPAGSGKSTVALKLANKMNWKYVTTGSIYRVFAYIVIKESLEFNDENIKYVSQNLISYYEQNLVTGAVFYKNENITDKIRLPEVSEKTSIIAANYLVRELLLPLQRKIVLGCGGAIVDGRDMGTIVFPEALLKVYLYASPEERAKRRITELNIKGELVDFNTLLKEIYDRDDRDANRAVAPMRPAMDAIILDSTLLSIDQVVQEIYAKALALAII